MPEILSECPVCGSGDHHLFFGVVDDYDKDFALCHVCKCAFRVNRPTEEENVEWYRSGAYRERTAKKASIEDEMRHQQNRGENIASLVDDMEVRSHLDIGCSGGSLLREVRKAHGDILSVGVDVDPVFRKLSEGLEVVPSIDDVWEYYDLITVIHTLEHIAKPREFIQKVADRLVDGGILIIEVPNRRAWMVAYGAPEHIIAYEINSLNYLLKSVGLKMAIYFYEGHIQGSPLDLNVIVIATNDEKLFMERRHKDGVKRVKKVYVHLMEKG
jgi:SAM-dependent methyltransferase